MSTAQYDALSTEPEARLHTVRFVGGTAAATKTYGNGMTVTYVSSGVVKISWSDVAENPGTFVGVVGYCFQATTPGNVKSYILVNEGYVASTRSILLNMYESGTLTDLAALEWLSVTFLFKETNV